MRWIALLVLLVAGCGGRVVTDGENGHGRLYGNDDDADVAPDSISTGGEASIAFDAPEPPDTSVEESSVEPSGPGVDASEFPDLPPCAERPPTCGTDDPTGSSRDTLSSQASACKAGLDMTGGSIPVKWCGTVSATFDAQGCLMHVTGTGLTRDQLACMFHPWVTAKKRWPCFAGTTVTVTGACP